MYLSIGFVRLFQPCWVIHLYLGMLYCLGTWNLRSMNQGKLEVVKLEMARVNVDILGISELNGLEWVNLTQMIIISTTAGRNPLEKMEQPS